MQHDTEELKYTREEMLLVDNSIERVLNTALEILSLPELQTPKIDRLAPDLETCIDDLHALKDVTVHAFNEARNRAYVRTHPETVSMRDRATAQGLKSYDSALPQHWVDHVTSLMGIDHYPAGHIVWCYDDSLMGYPVALDTMGRKILGMLAS